MFKKKGKYLYIYIFKLKKEVFNVIVFLYFKWYILLNIIILLKVIFYEWYFNYFLKKKICKNVLCLFQIGKYKENIYVCNNKEKNCDFNYVINKFQVKGFLRVFQ